MKNGISIRKTIFNKIKNKHLNKIIMSNHYLTKHITDNNINNVRFNLGYKLNYNVPYYGTIQSAENVITDFDEFPYKRNFRGVYNQSNPTILEREAGFRPRHDNCYKKIVDTQVDPATYCWEYPCSTIFPCKAHATTPEELKSSCLTSLYYR
jgi:hypothetical protein